MTSSPDRPSTLAALFREAAARAKVSVKELAAKTKLPESRLRAFLADGGDAPDFSLGELVAICKALGLDIRQLAISAEVRVEQLPPTFGTLLKQLMDEAGMKQKDLAEESGIPVSTLNQYLLDRRSPGLQVAIVIARALGKDLSVFEDVRFGNSSDEKNEEK